MKIIVDTSVWSLALRRSSPNKHHQKILTELIEENLALLIGAVRQELLSGIKLPKQFEKLRKSLRAFPDVALENRDYEIAAQFFNECRSKGIQGSTTDFLICAVAANRSHKIYATDKDFALYASVLPVDLFHY